MKSIAEKSIRETIKKRSLIRKNVHVVIGLSGGPDSMCLFHVLLDMRNELGFKISAVHLNHRFRPVFAEEDQKFVEDLCQSNGIFCYSKTVDVNNIAAIRGETPEEAGRNERYVAFDEEALRIEKSGIRKDDIVIAVAQNRNDRAETVLMRILRGTGPDGLEGIPYERKSKSGFLIVRPLLDTDRKDIEEYCQSRKLMPRIDHTNDETAYNRNRIRIDLIPELKDRYNPNLEEALLRLSSFAALDKDYFDNISREYFDNYCVAVIDDVGNTVIRTDVVNLTALHPSAGSRAVIFILKALGLDQGIEAVHIDALMDAAVKNQTGKITELPSGYRMRTTYGTLEFYRDQGSYTEAGSHNPGIVIDVIGLNKYEEIVLPGGMLVIRTSVVQEETTDKNLLYLAFDEIKNTGGSLEIRYRKPGDRISLTGMSGTKKLQDLLVDEKIDREKRDEIPLLVSDQEILWVIGVRKSDKCTGMKGLKDCILLEWKPNN